MGLTIEEPKLFASNHNNDNGYRHKMSSIDRIRFFHDEYLDVKQKFSVKLHLGLRRQCLHEVDIVVDDNVFFSKKISFISIQKNIVRLQNCTITECYIQKG